VKELEGKEAIVFSDSILLGLITVKCVLDNKKSVNPFISLDDVKIELVTSLELKIALGEILEMTSINPESEFENES